jgi:hypothetical protein
MTDANSRAVLSAEFQRVHQGVKLGGGILLCIGALLVLSTMAMAVDDPLDKRFEALSGEIHETRTELESDLSSNLALGEARYETTDHHLMVLSIVVCIAIAVFSIIVATIGVMVTVIGILSHRTSRARDKALKEEIERIRADGIKIIRSSLGESEEAADMRIRSIARLILTRAIDCMNLEKEKGIYLRNTLDTLVRLSSCIPSEVCNACVQIRTLQSAEGYDWSFAKGTLVDTLAMWERKVNEAKSVEACRKAMNPVAEIRRTIESVNSMKAGASPFSPPANYEGDGSQKEVPGTSDVPGT